MGPVSPRSGSSAATWSLWSPWASCCLYAAPRLATWPRIAVAALAFPVAIELAQLAVSLLVGYSYRVTEVDDVLLNFAGVLLGFALYVALSGTLSAPVTDAAGEAA